MQLKDKCIASHILVSTKLTTDKCFDCVKYKRFGKIFEMCLYFNVNNAKDVWRLKKLALQESQYMKCNFVNEKLVLSFYAPSKYVDLLTAINRNDYPLFNNTLLR